MIGVKNSKIDSYALRDIIVQGEAGSDVIIFTLDPSLSGYTWRVRGTINGGSVESDIIFPVERANEVTVSWTVDSAFTGEAGMLYLTLVGTKTNGTVITKAVGAVEILPDMAMQAAGTVPQNLFERLIAATEGYSRDSEAWAVGKRNGVNVPPTDPAYHNNAYWYSQQTAQNNYESLTNKPSINGVTLLGNKTAGELGIAEACNINLLDNPWFQINQRGGSPYTNAGYTVDRWKMTGNTNSVAVNEDGVKLTAGETYFQLEQLIENYKALAGKTVTFSADIKAVTGSESCLRVYADNVVVGESSSPLTVGINSVIVTLPDTINSSIGVRIMVSKAGTTGSLNVRSVKLEVGSVSTLAFDSAPNYALELAKCQRFYERVPAGTSNFSYGMGMAFDASDITVPISLKPKRTTPTIGGKENFRAGTTAYNISSFTSIIVISANLSNETGLYTLQMTKGSAFAAGQVYRIGIVSNGYIDFSADL